MPAAQTHFPLCIDAHNVHTHTPLIYDQHPQHDALYSFLFVLEMAMSSRQLLCFEHIIFGQCREHPLIIAPLVWQSCQIDYSHTNAGLICGRLLTERAVLARSIRGT